MAGVPHPTTDVAELVAVIEVAAGGLTAVWAHAEEAEQALVSMPQLRALDVIGRVGTLNLNGLASELGTIASSASRLVDRLVAAGFVSREQSRATRREITLTLRPAGTALLGRLQQARRAEIAAVVATMTPAAARALARGLEAFAQAAESRDNESLAQA